MSHVDQAITAIKAAARDLGMNVLAERADVKVETARRMVRRLPRSISDLKKLEAEALKHLAGEP